MKRLIQKNVVQSAGIYGQRSMEKQNTDKDIIAIIVREHLLLETRKNLLLGREYGLKSGLQAGTHYLTYQKKVVGVLLLLGCYLKTFYALCQFPKSNPITTVI